jgi:hypothetical protein
MINCLNHDSSDYMIDFDYFLFLIIVFNKSINHSSDYFNHSLPAVRQVQDYSYRNASTGFFEADFQVCQLTVMSVMIHAIDPATAKIHQLSVVL